LVDKTFVLSAAGIWLESFDSSTWSRTPHWPTARLHIWGDSTDRGLRPVNFSRSGSERF